MNGPERYDTIRGESSSELEISRSRFLCRLVRVETEDAAREVIREVRAEHSRARHHCSAFVLGPDARLQRSNDDGEPGGTAGAPMLDALVSAQLSDVVAVVTRYFGGVLLGAGGLTRAYRASVAEAVHAATRVTRESRQLVTLALSYEHAATVEAEARRNGWVVEGSEYAEGVTMRLRVVAEQVPRVLERTAELTAGAGLGTVGDFAYADVG